MVFVAIATMSSFSFSSISAPSVYRAVFAVSITECLETLLVAVASGYEINLGPVVEGLGIGSWGPFWKVLLIEMELPVNV